MRIFSFCIILTLALTVFSPNTAANIDIPEAVVNALTFIENNYKSAMETKREIDQNINHVRAGAAEVKKAVADPFAELGINPEGIPVTIPSTLSAAAYDPLDAADKIAKDHVATYGKGDDVEVFKKQEFKDRQILFEELAGLYAMVLNNHAKLHQEQTKEEVQTTERELIQAVAQKNLNSLKRLSYIAFIRSSGYNYNMAAKARTFMNREQADD